MIIEILVVLGSPNSSSGELSNISKDRLDCCLKVFKKGQLILLTGGWGLHFNTSDNPHASYGKKYLVEKGISESVFLDFALSENTVDDALKIKSTLSYFKKEKINLSIITSDFHMKRVILIFNEILEEFKMKFLSAKSELRNEELIYREKHEKRAIELIKRNGLNY